MMARRHASTEGRRYVCSLTTRADSNSAAFRARQGPPAACGGALARSLDPCSHRACCSYATKASLRRERRTEGLLDRSFLLDGGVQIQPATMSAVIGPAAIETFTAEETHALQPYFT